MKKRELFVFSGQSNMMGACVYPPTEQISFDRSFQYYHTPKRLKEDCGVFQANAYPCGEFCYKDLKKAYENTDVYGKSLLNDYQKNTYFCPSLSNLQSDENKSEYPFSRYSESNASVGASLAPYIVKEWEGLNRQCNFTHIAKGNVSINYYFNKEMIEKLNKLIKKYNLKNKADLPYQELSEDSGVGDYFIEKIKDFFADSKKVYFNENLDTKCFFWLQGESDCSKSKQLYKLYLQVLWGKLKTLGFTHFFCIRVGFWEKDSVTEIMKAQEEFCQQEPDAYMLTRVCSYMPTPNQNIEKWYGRQENVCQFLNCRDSFFGFNNNHINQRGFEIISKASIKNLRNVLIDNLPVQIEQEKCLPLK